MIDDAELLRRYTEEHDEEAFAALVQQRLPLVYAVARRRLGGDGALAQDVAQRVFADLAAKAGSLCRHPALVAWLFASTRYAAAQMARAEQRRRVREERAIDMSDEPKEAGVDWEQVRPALDELIDGLATRDREAVMLRFFEGRACAEIGTRLRLSEDGARARVERALEKLRVHLARRGVRSTTAALGLALTGQAQAAVPTGLAAAVTQGALAGVGTAGATGAAAWVAFMSTGKMAGVACVLLVAAVVVGVREHARADAAERARDEQVVVRAQWQTRAGEAERRAIALAATARPAAGTQMGVAPSATATDAAEAEARAEQDRLVASDPELQQLYVRQQIVRHRSTYGPFYRSAGLSAEQIARFERVMAEYAQASVDVPVAALVQGVSKNDGVVSTLMERAVEERNRALREVLGEEGLAAWKDFDRFRKMRTLAEDMAKELYYTDTPLTWQQADALTQIVRTASRQGGGKVDMGFVVDEARKVLAPEQVRAVETRKEFIDLAQAVMAKNAQWREKYNHLPMMQEDGPRK